MCRPAPGPTLLTRRRLDTPTVVVIILVASVVPLLLSWHYGALGIPHDDDWQFHRSLATLADDGRFDAGTWASMSLVGQLVVALPVAKATGNSIAGAQMVDLVLASLALLAVASLAARCLPGLPRSWLLLVVLCPVFTTMWWPLAASFMTDIPTLAFMMFSLALGITAFGDTERPIRWPTLLVATATGVFAFTIRELAAVVPAALLITAGLRAFGRGTRRDRAGVVVTALTVLLAMSVFYLWRRSLGGWILDPAVPTPSTVLGGLELVPKYAALVGLALLPLVAASRPSRVLRSAWAASPRLMLAVSSFWFIVLVPRVLSWISTGGDALEVALGTYLLPNGVQGDVVLDGTRTSLVPDWLFGSILVVGMASACVASFALVARWSTLVELLKSDAPEHAPVRPIALTIVLYGAGVLAVNAVDIPVFDRYVLLILPLLAITVAWALGPELHDLQSVPPATWLAVAGLTVFSLVYATDAAEFSALRWRLASEMAESVDPTLVDGGFEWRGYYRGTQWVVDSPFCIVVSVESELPPDALETLSSRSLLRKETVVATRSPC